MGTPTSLDGPRRGGRSLLIVSGIGGILLVVLCAAIAWKRGAASAAEPLREQLAHLQAKYDAVVTEAAVTRQERDAWRQKVTDASGQLDQHVQLSDSMTTDLQKEKATSAALKKQLAAANKELTDAQEQATAHQKSAESASESASAAKAEAADLHRQLKESQKAQEASAESSRALAQKDETIKELRARLDDANRKSAAGFTKSVKKGDHGTVVWYGSTRSGPVVIENGRPNVGTLIGSIPHRLCKLELSGTRSSVVVAPSEENDWSRLELKLDPADFAVVRVDWTVIR